MNELLSALWFFLPAGLANAAPVAAAKLPGLKRFNTSMDFGKSWHGERIFGANKTWRGLLAGIIAATVIVALQKYLFAHTAWAPNVSWVDYAPGTIWLLGPLLGGGALLGDAIKSHFKRRASVAPGHAWFPFDQIDYIIGGSLFSLIIVQLSLGQYLWIFGAWFGMHLLTVFVFYHLGIRDKPI